MAFHSPTLAIRAELMAHRPESVVALVHMIRARETGSYRQLRPVTTAERPPVRCGWLWLRPVAGVAGCSRMGSAGCRIADCHLPCDGYLGYR